MALKFLNKKGWHTGSLRNIENVWKAEQKHEAEEKKLEELKKQIHDEREAQEFRLLQEQAGLVPKQERLEFLYDSGLAVGKSSNDEYLLGKPIDAKEAENDVAKVAAAPGALFVEEKPQSANEMWRRIHSDPLLLIRQQEQAALARIRNNPVKMGMIKKSAEEKLSKREKKQKHKKEKRPKEERREKKKQRLRLPSSGYSSDDGSKQINRENDRERKGFKDCGSRYRDGSDGERSQSRGADRSNLRKEKRDKLYGSMSTKHYNLDDLKSSKLDLSAHKRRHESLKSFEKCCPKTRSKHPDDPRSSDARIDGGESVESEKDESAYQKRTADTSFEEPSEWSQKPNNQKAKYKTGKLSEEERAARLKEMQLDAKVHEEQRWHRLKRASDADAREEARRSFSTSKTFLDQTARNIYGADQGDNVSVTESVRRRTHFIARSLGDSNVNTFQRS